MSQNQLDWMSGPRLTQRLMKRFGLEASDLPYSKDGGQLAIDDCKQFSSYDYLNLRRHPRVLTAAAEALYAHGMSATASRIVAGELDYHHRLEARLAAVYGQEAALLFVSGHATNVSTVAALVERGDLILLDQFSHNSLQIGARLSGARVLRFRHNDINHLEHLLKRYRASHRACLIATEGHFSMDGDSPDLAALCDARTRFHATLLVDEAHSLGVLGTRGLGLHDQRAMDPGGVDIWMGTLSKSLGSTGGFIASRQAVVNHLRFYAPGFTYSVGLNAPSCAAAEQALALIGENVASVHRLQRNSIYLWNTLRGMGLDLGSSQGTAIIPIILPAKLAMASSSRLLELGWSVYPLAPPSVPATAFRLRVFVRADHEQQHLDNLADAIQDCISNLASR